MAGRATRPCAQPGCPNLVTVGRRCPDHQRDEDRHRPNRHQRGYGNEWARRSAEAIRRQPWCSNCQSTDDLTADHPTPMARGGERLPDLGELVVLCRPCNSAKGAN